MGTKIVAVTGASGYVGSHCVRELVARGYRVRATVRDDRAEAKTAHLESLGATIFAAELETGRGFEEAFAGVSAVLHCASVVKIRARDPQREIIDPAVRGTENVLRACAAVGSVGRVVLTSSASAIVDAKRRHQVFTEADWNESATVATEPYDRSKVEAERRALELADELKLELVALHPSVILGPLLAPHHVSSSPSIVAELLRGAYPAIPELCFGLVDVRDVARAHVAALEARAASSRYICHRGTWSLRQVARELRHVAPQAKVSRLPLPGLVMLGASLFDPRINLSWVRRHLGNWTYMNAERAQRELGISFRPIRETLEDCTQSLYDFGLV